MLSRKKTNKRKAKGFLKTVQDLDNNSQSKSTHSFGTFRSDGSYKTLVIVIGRDIYVYGEEGREFLKAALGDEMNNVLTCCCDEDQSTKNILTQLIDRIEKLEVDSKTKDEKIRELEEQLKKNNFFSGSIPMLLSNFKLRLDNFEQESKKTVINQIEHSDISQTESELPSLEVSRKKTREDYEVEKKQREEYWDSAIADYMDKKIMNRIDLRVRAEHEAINVRFDKLHTLMNQILETKKKIDTLDLLSGKDGLKRVFAVEVRKVYDDVKARSEELITAIAERYLSDFGLTASDVKQINQFTSVTTDKLTDVIAKLETFDKKFKRRLANGKAKINIELKKINAAIPELFDKDDLNAELASIKEDYERDFPSYKLFDYFDVEVTSENCDEIFDALIVDYSEYLKRTGVAQYYNPAEIIKPKNIWDFAAFVVGYEEGAVTLKSALIERHGLSLNKLSERSGVPKASLSRAKNDPLKLSALLDRSAKDDEFKCYYYDSESGLFLPDELISFW